MSWPRPWPHLKWLTQDDWVENLGNTFLLKRWYVRETPGLLYVYVDGNAIQDLALSSEGQTAAGVIVIIKPLPWWRGRFRPQQWVQDF